MSILFCEWFRDRRTTAFLFLSFIGAGNARTTAFLCPTYQWKFGRERRTTAFPSFLLMERKLVSDEQKALELLALLGYDGHVVCHEPSRLIPLGNVHLMTQEEARSHLESSQNIALLFPSREQGLGICRSLSGEQKVVTVVQETSSFLSMIENTAKVIDFLGDKRKYLQRIYRLLPEGDLVRSKDLTYFAYDFCKSAGEQFEIHWTNDVTWDDLILPAKTVMKYKVEQTLLLATCLDVSINVCS